MLKISRIQIEKEPVYDITVPETESFFANDILVHNCNEIELFSDKDHTFTCVLSSLNVSKYDEWKNTNVAFWATVFLDCVAEEFIQRGKSISGLENAVRFTEKSRALGLGQCGFHTYIQSKMISFESFEAHMLNNEICKHIWDKANEATIWMAEKLGEPEWCEGYGRRNTHLIAIAPTKSCVAENTKFKLSDGSVISFAEIIEKNNIKYDDAID
jgi:ribonucleotide reductase alpha subunit